MLKRLRDALASRCKDMGLTPKALEDLARLGSEGLEEGASEEDIMAKADLLVPYARMVQGEITRKTQRRAATEHPRAEEIGGDGGAVVGSAGEVPAWFEERMKGLVERMDRMQSANDALAAERKAAERRRSVEDTARRLGIPDYLMKRVSIADDADIERELTDYKQDLVNNSLMGRDAPRDPANERRQMEKDAEEWAKSLPDK